MNCIPRKERQTSTWLPVTTTTAKQWQHTCLCTYLVFLLFGQSRNLKRSIYETACSRSPRIHRADVRKPVLSSTPACHANAPRQTAQRPAMQTWQRCVYATGQRLSVRRGRVSNPPFPAQCFSAGSACVMLPGSSFVSIVSFWWGNRFTSVSNVRYPGRSIFT